MCHPALLERLQATAGCPTRSLSLTIVRRSQHVIRMMCSRSISLQISAFVPFCDVREGSVCVSRGWRNTLDLWQAQHFVLLHFAISLAAGVAGSGVVKFLFC